MESVQKCPLNTLFWFSTEKNFDCAFNLICSLFKLKTKVLILNQKNLLWNTEIKTHHLPMWRNSDICFDVFNSSLIIVSFWIHHLINSIYSNSPYWYQLTSPNQYTTINSFCIHFTSILYHVLVFFIIYSIFIHNPNIIVMTKVIHSSYNTVCLCTHLHLIYFDIIYYTYAKYSNNIKKIMTLVFVLFDFVLFVSFSS